MRRTAADFTARRGIAVHVESGIHNLEARLAEAFAANASPDVFRYSPARVPLASLADVGDPPRIRAIINLEPLIRRDRFDITDFKPSALDHFRWGAALHAIPRDHDLRLIYYHTELFDRAELSPLPTDWEDVSWTFHAFLDASRRLVATGPRHATLVPRAGRSLYSWIYSNGGSVDTRDEAGLTTGIALSEEPALAALQYLRHLIHVHRVAPPPGDDTSLDGAIASMAVGDLAMLVASSSSSHRFRDARVPFNVGVFPIGPGGARRGVGGTGTGWALSVQNHQLDAAWALVMAASSRPSHLEEALGGWVTPPRRSVSGDPALHQAGVLPLGARALLDGQDYVVPGSRHPRWPRVEAEAIRPLLPALWSGQRTAAQVTDEIAAIANPLLTS